MQWSLSLWDRFNHMRRLFLVQHGLMIGYVCFTLGSMLFVPLFTVIGDPFALEHKKDAGWGVRVTLALASFVNSFVILAQYLFVVGLLKSRMEILGFYHYYWKDCYQGLLIYFRMG